MLCFFHSAIDYTVHLPHEGNFVYTHNFSGVEVSDSIPMDKILVTTPSDLKRLRDQCVLQGTKTEVLKCLKPKSITDHDQYPKDVGFKSNLEEAYGQFEGKEKVSVAIMNAMSNAYGDHLIGCNALSVFRKRLKEKYPNTEFIFNLFQLNPLRHAPITKQWGDCFNTAGTMPVKLNLFFSHDAYIDLGGLILFEKFNTMPMTDFFLHALSIDPETVHDEDKRIKYELDPKSQYIMKILDEHIRKRANGRPVLFFHSKATTPIRSMPEKKAKRLVKGIIDKSDYFVISASGLKMKNSRHMDVSNFSHSFDDFAAIISNSDAVVTVDTSTVHLAECFQKPTVSYFTCVDPKYRTKYYPLNKSIMIEKEGGMIHGKHKFDPNSEKGKEAEKYSCKLWDRVTADKVIVALDEVVSRTINTT